MRTSEERARLITGGQRKLNKSIEKRNNKGYMQSAWRPACFW